MQFACLLVVQLAGRQAAPPVYDIVLNRFAPHRPNGNIAHSVSIHVEWMKARILAGSTRNAARSGMPPAWITVSILRVSLIFDAGWPLTIRRSARRPGANVPQNAVPLCGVNGELNG
jgi:hypothetical protein